MQMTFIFLPCAWSFRQSRRQRDVYKRQQYKRVMIFCNTKDMTARLCDRLKKAGYQAECLHGDVRQSFRDKVMSGFRKGEFEILVATDVAARGIDVDDVEAAVSYTHLDDCVRGGAALRRFDHAAV